jgi:bifunctional non-homologous end joining protein LigD
MIKPPRSKPLLADPDAPLRGGVRKRRDPSQPQLPLDPMPARVEPALALVKSKPPRGDQWVYEIKWDGYRLAVHVEPTGVRILTRGGHDWTHRFPGIAEAAKSFGTTIILDGEAVVVDAGGRPNFGMLQQALGGRRGKRVAHEVMFFAFDILYFDGHDLQSWGLSERRQVLEGLIQPEGREAIFISEEVATDGQVLFEAACKNGLEGIIAKDRNAPYRSGRTGDWVKVKCVQSDSFCIIGYEPSTAALGGIGRLLLAAYKGNRLVHVGGVGTGFKETPTIALRKELDKIVTEKPAVHLKRKNTTWVKPRLIAEIEYRAWTEDCMLRHASYKGLREEQDNADVYRITE